MIVPFNYNAHAKQILSWGREREFTLPAPEFLPDLGFIAHDAAVGFLYLTNSKLAWMEWVISNPNKTFDERKLALDHLVETIEKVAQAEGVKVIFSACQIRAYREVLERNQFQKTDSNLTHYIKRIGVNSWPH